MIERISHSALISNISKDFDQHSKLIALTAGAIFTHYVLREFPGLATIASLGEAFFLLRPEKNSPEHMYANPFLVDLHKHRYALLTTTGISYVSFKMFPQYAMIAVIASTYVFHAIFRENFDPLKIERHIPQPKCVSDMFSALFADSQRAFFCGWEILCNRHTHRLFLDDNDTGYMIENTQFQYRHQHQVEGASIQGPLIREIQGNKIDLALAVQLKTGESNANTVLALQTGDSFTDCFTMKQACKYFYAYDKSICQEDFDIFIRSNIFLALDHPNFRSLADTSSNAYKVVYIPRVQIFRKSRSFSYAFFDGINQSVEQLNIICFGREKIEENGDAQAKTKMKLQLRQILHAAMDNNQKLLILGIRSRIEEQILREILQEPDYLAETSLKEIILIYEGPAEKNAFSSTNSGQSSAQSVSALTNGSSATCSVSSSTCLKSSLAQEVVHGNSVGSLMQTSASASSPVGQLMSENENKKEKENKKKHLQSSIKEYQRQIDEVEVDLRRSSQLFSHGMINIESIEGPKNLLHQYDITFTDGYGIRSCVEVTAGWALQSSIETWQKAKKEMRKAQEEVLFLF